MQKSKVVLLSYNIYKKKIYSKWITDLIVRAKTITLSEENWKKLHNISFGNNLFAMPQKAQ